MIFDLNNYTLINYEYLLKNENPCCDLISYIRSGAYKNKGRKDPNIGRDGIRRCLLNYHAVQLLF